MSERLILILGGTRSGKSRFGSARARELAGDQPVAYLATALPGDPELDRRIAGHRRERPRDWPVVVVGHDLEAAIRSIPRSRVILLDGLTLWASAIFRGEPDELDLVLDGPFEGARVAIRERPGPVVVVSDEIGLGLVPMDPLAREFRDLLGIVHQRLASDADEVYLMVAGIPLELCRR